MKLASVALLCLAFLLVLTHFTLARKGMSIGGRSTTNRGGSTASNRGSANRGSANRGSANPGKKTTKATQPQPGSYPKQADPKQWRPASNQWGYPQPGRGAGYPNQHGGYGHGGYPGGHMNYNPNNRILSPGYGGSYGYGGNGGVGGSPFARSVQGMGMNPSMRSKGFGRSAAVAAGVGVMSGMALGYGLGRFPRPHFPFHSPQEESSYNHYMYKRYGSRSTDGNDYSRDYQYSPPPIPFDKHMDTCMNATRDTLPSANEQETNRPARAMATPTPTTTATTATATPTPTTTATTATATATATVTATASPITPTAADGSTGNDTPGSNRTVTDNVLTTLSPNQTDKPKADPLPPASEDLSKVDDGDDDTVSIVEIGYPALIEQLKARRCVELYMVYSDRYLKKRSARQRDTGPHGGAQGTGEGLQRVFAVVTGTFLMLMSSNVLMLP